MPGPTPAPQNRMLDILRMLGVKLPTPVPATAREPWRDMPGSGPNPVADAVLGALTDFPKGLLTGGGAEPGMSWENLGGLVGQGLPIVGAVAGLPGMFSRAQKAAGGLPERISVQSVMNMLKKMGAPPEELAVTRLAESLPKTGQVARADVAAKLEAGLPKLDVKTRAGTDKSADLIARRDAAHDRMLDWNLTADERDAALVERDYLEELMEHPSSDSPKFGQYQVPGGENYREDLITMAPRGRPVDVIDAEMNSLHEIDLPMDQFTERLNALQLERNSVKGVADQSVNYSSPHWDEPNVLAHVRSNERTLPTGERGRFLEEVQSDWHQQGKAGGYRLSSEQTSPMDSEYRVLVHKNAAARDAGQAPIPEDVARAQALEAALMRSDASKIPDAPFKDAWPDLALKQQLTDVAQRPDLDWMGFTTGARQAERYDLSKQISEVHYSGTNLKAYDLEGQEVISRTGVTPQELPDYIGKEAAERLMAQEPQGTLRSLTGQDLKVGGEGMGAFYDKLLPARLEKIVKGFGGKVEQGLVTIPGGTEPAWILRLPPAMKEAIRTKGLPLMTLAPFLMAQTVENYQ